jgi:cytochrome subunit of sulfide dehydrogenase
MSARVELDGTQGAADTLAKSKNLQDAKGGGVFMRLVAALAATLVALPLTVHSQPEQGRTLAAACGFCHGTDGRSAAGMAPLAGMPKEEMVRKMNEFRTGAMPATVMHQIAKGYTDTQIAAMAEYFAARRAGK